MMIQNQDIHRLVAKANQRKDKSVSRMKQYAGIVLVLFALFFIIGRVPWQGDHHSHTLMEAVPTVAAFVVGVLALIRYYGHQDNLFLLLGTGFIGTGFFDLYHTIVTHPYYQNKVLNLPSHLVPWSWLASRIFLAASLLLAVIFWLREKKNRNAARLRSEYVYLTAAILMVGSYFFFLFIPLPVAYHAWRWGPWVIGRPQEFLAGIMFLAALGFLLKDRSWRRHDFVHWLVISLIINVFVQMLVMASSVRLYDAYFDTAHVLKQVGYWCVFIGLCYSIYGLFDDHKRLLVELNQSLSWVDNILETVPVGVAVLTIEGLIIKSNWMWCNIYGYDKYELIGRSFLDLAPPEDRQWAWERFLEYIKNPYVGEVSSERELKGLRKDGSVVDVDISMGYFDSDTEPLIIVCSQNISELKRVMYNLKDKSERLMQQREMLLELSRKMQAPRKMLEKANRDLKNSNEELKKFAYIASHDLQEPLRTMAGFSNLLVTRYAEQLDETGRRHLQFIHDGALRLQRLIKDLLTYARLGSDDLNQEAVDLGEVCREVEGLLTDLIRSTKGTITHTDLPVLVGNRQLITELMLNLISNALKFHHPQRPPVVRITATREAEHWVIAVADNGQGIPQSFQDKAFELFRRLPQGDRKIEGTGIGLALCEKIVKTAGGRIWMESIEGQGTTIYFTWPVEQIMQKGDLDDAVSSAAY